LGNARVFDGEDWSFPLGRINVFCGTNSAGKTTALKTLLLLRNALSSRELALGNQASRSMLRFKTSLFDLGNFQTFISHRDIRRKLQLGITNASTFDSSGLKGSRVDPSQPPESSTPYICGADFYFVHRNVPSGSPIDEKAESLDELEARPVFENQVILEKANFWLYTEEPELRMTFQVESLISDDSQTLSYHLYLPKTYVAQIEYLADFAIGLRDDDTYDFEVVLRGLLPDQVVISRQPSDIQDEAKALRRFWPLPAHLEEILQDFRTAVGRLAYLGPLRAPAQRYYTGQSDTVDSDPTGGSLPYLVRERQHTVVQSAAPISHELERITLGTALDNWLFFLRTGQECASRPSYRKELSIDSSNENLIQIDLRSFDGSEKYGLLDSGFGYSQLLPILVRGLVIARGGLLMVEEPEVHLNPALQLRLADFFVAMAKCGKQIIIETHSEHIVNALRAISAEGGIAPSCNIYFLESAPGKPTVHKLHIEEDGSVPHWPPSFFGESSQILSRLLRAGKLKDTD
jgi:predicted ATPase